MFDSLSQPPTVVLGAAAMALSMPMKRRAHHNTAVTKTRVPLTEDEEMAMAIAQSMVRYETMSCIS